MMAFVVAKKFFPFLLILILTKCAGDIVEKELNVLPMFAAYFLLIMTFSPQILLVFKGFRQLVFDQLKQHFFLFMSYFGALLSVQALVCFSIISASTGWEPPNNIMYSFVAIGGGSAAASLLAELKKHFK